MTTVLCFGTFDLLHPGHLDLFRQAKQHGDRLVVVLALDETIQQVKGRAPIHNQEFRAQALEQLAIVDEVRFGYPDDRYRVIEEIRPDVIFLGYDQHVFVEGLAKALQERGLAPHILRGEAYQPERYKSSLLRAAL